MLEERTQAVPPEAGPAAVDEAKIDAADETLLARAGHAIGLWRTLGREKALWVLVILLLLAVVGVGGYVLGGVIEGDRRPRSAAEAEVARWSEEVRRSPGSIEAHLQLGYSYQQAGNLDKAMMQYTYVIEKDPRNTGALYNRGVVYRRLGLGKQAEVAFWDVLEIEPDHVLAAMELGQYYADRHQYRSLITAVRPVVLVHPEVSGLQYLMGVAYENLGRPDWAKARYRLALKYAPDYVEARDALKRLGEIE
jgi:tetratricopeptide (TPR) repeat protein